MTENGTILPPEETPKQDDSCRAEPAPRAQAASPADVKRSRFLGCLLGGAVGDALGYPVEFRREKAIRAQYGPDGIRALEQAGSPAPVSDDTQMTLFAAASLVYAARNGRGVRESLWLGYREWLGTQGDTSRMDDPEDPALWIFRDKRLHRARAPGNTCLQAIRTSSGGGSFDRRPNNSKGCGTVMRASPFGLAPACLLQGGGRNAAGQMAETDAVLTHGHPLALASSGMLARLIYYVVRERPERDYPLEEAIRAILFPGDNALAPLLNRAIELALNRAAVSDAEGIRALGGGWVAEEALAIAVFCAVRYQNDFGAAVRAAVNHDGDSDSTGAVCGNLLGAWLGEEAVRQAFCLEQLELRDLVEAQALALFALAEPDPPRAGLIYTPLTKAALRLCFQAHSGQTDKGGLPYVIHPLHLAEQMETEEEICAALLHDSIEDAFVTPEALHAAGFPEGVVEAVRLLTRPQGMPYLAYIAALRANPIARRVKTADLRHNLDFARLGTVTAADRQRAETYRDALRLLLADSI